MWGKSWKWTFQPTTPPGETTRRQINSIILTFNYGRHLVDGEISIHHPTRGQLTTAAAAAGTRGWVSRGAPPWAVPRTSPDAKSVRRLMPIPWVPPILRSKYVFLFKAHSHLSLSLSVKKVDTVVLHFSVFTKSHHPTKKRQVGSTYGRRIPTCLKNQVPGESHL